MLPPPFNNFHESTYLADHAISEGNVVLPLKVLEEFAELDKVWGHLHEYGNFTSVIEESGGGVVVFKSHIMIVNYDR